MLSRNAMIGLGLTGVAVLGGVYFGSQQKDGTKTRSRSAISTPAIAPVVPAPGALELAKPSLAPASSAQIAPAPAALPEETAAPKQAPKTAAVASAPAPAKALAASNPASDSIPLYGRAIYKSVDERGRITYSERYPNDPKARLLLEPGAGTQSSTANSSLPLELRTISARFPVVLYTASGCGPCNSARSFLTARGIPFSERTIKTAQDTQALQALSGETSIPLLTIGQQQVKGFSDSEYAQYLDAAEYPKTSQLPPTYSNPAPTAMVQSSDASTLTRDTSGGAPPGTAAASTLAGANGTQLIIESSGGRRGSETEAAKQARLAREAEAAAKAANPAGIKF